MKRILYVVCLMLGLTGLLYAGGAYGDLYSVNITTNNETIINNPCSVSTFDVENFTVSVQTVTISDGSTAKWKMIVPAYSGRSIDFDYPVRFNSKLRASSQATVSSNHRVKLQCIGQ